MDYVGTVWYRRSVPTAGSATFHDVWTKQVVKLTATGVDDFKDHVRTLDGHTQGAVQIEFGPIGQSWAQQRRRG